MQEVRLALSTPSCRDWKPAFGASLCGLVRKLSQDGIKGVSLQNFDLSILQGASVLPRARQAAIDWAKQGNATHLLCIDDDMQFPSDILDDMFRHDVDILALNYTRKNPVSPTPLTHGLDGAMVSSLGFTGLEEVAWVGFGIILIKLDAIKDIPAPLFETRWMEERQDFVGEDFYFCGKVRQHGVKIYIDHDASNKIRHIGDIPYWEGMNSQVGAHA